MRVGRGGVDRIERRGVETHVRAGISGALREQFTELHANLGIADAMPSDRELRVVSPQSHDDGLWPSLTLEHREVDGVLRIGEQTAATASSIYHNPPATIVLPNAKAWRL